ncbi:MAG: cupin domain-containing protein [Candidatus Humimicrobiaceae bacterium]
MDKLIFTISTLLPGQKACLDKGHKGADEIVYVINGTIIIHLPDIDECHKLNEGDALLIPDGEPHYSMNAGEIKSVTAWACAPHLLLIY